MFKPVLLLMRVGEDIARELLLEADRGIDAVLSDCDAELPGLTLAIDPADETLVPAVPVMPKEEEEEEEEEAADAAIRD